MQARTRHAVAGSGGDHADGLTGPDDVPHVYRGCDRLVRSAQRAMNDGDNTATRQHSGVKNTSPPRREDRVTRLGQEVDAPVAALPRDRGRVEGGRDAWWRRAA